MKQTIKRWVVNLQATLAVALMLPALNVFAQDCPTPTLTAPAICAGQTPNFVLSTSPASPGPYSLVINGTTYTGVVPGTPFAINESLDNFWGNTVPITTGFEDPNPYELGLKFKSSVNGYILGIRFYRDPRATGTFTGTLWTAGGTALATGTFAINGTGWQELRFATPVAITAGTTYVASYFSPNGRYSIDVNRFTSSSATSTLGNLTAPASGGPDGPNGVYRAGSTGFPASSFDDANYYVDVIFSTDLPVTTFNLTSITGPGCASTGAPLSSATLTVNPLPTGVISSPGTPTAGQSNDLVFTAAAGTGPYSLNINGTTFSGVSSGVNFNAGVVPVNSNYSLWTSEPFPGPQPNNDGRPVEVGIKFKPRIDGNITALRFYKYAPDANSTVLRLYSASGTVLASVTHNDGNVSSGFITVPLPTPVAVTGNTVYVVSYFSANGDYVKTDGYLATERVNGQLKAVANGGPDGPSGVYRYDSQGLPDQSCTTCGGPNYWADVVLNTVTRTYDYNLNVITDNNGCTTTPGQRLTLDVLNPLPVSLVAFTGTAVQQDVKLEWTTASESNNRGFEIQRSLDAGKWIGVGFVNGAGNSQVKQSYQFTDRNRPTGKFFYRLKQVDIDGRFSYSNILAIDINGKLGFELQQNFPNPSHGATTITYSVPNRSHVKLVIYDTQGRVVSVLQNGEQPAGKYAVSVPEGLLNRGVYYYKMEAGGFTATRKMVVQ